MQSVWRQNQILASNARAPSANARAHSSMNASAAAAEACTPPTSPKNEQPTQRVWCHCLHISPYHSELCLFNLFQVCQELPECSAIISSAERGHAVSLTLLEGLLERQESQHSPEDSPTPPTTSCPQTHSGHTEVPSPDEGKPTEQEVPSLLREDSTTSVLEESMLLIRRS